MFTYNKSFSGFSTNNISAAKDFYTQTLGIIATEENGMLRLHLEDEKTVLIYPKDNHVPATYTVLAFDFLRHLFSNTGSNIVYRSEQK